MPVDFTAVNTASLIRAALFYARQGIRVFPVEPGEKHPRIINPSGARLPWGVEATTDFDKILAWWTRWPDANIGLVMSNGLHALDLDRKGGADGVRSFEALIGDPRPQLVQPLQSTPSNGFHLVFRAPDLELRNFAKRGQYGGLDFRTTGGFIVGAPSQVGGKCYQWVRGTGLDVLLPPELLAAIKTLAPGEPRSSAEFPLVDPADLSDAEVATKLQALPIEHREFLETGEADDASSAAYWACVAAFRGERWTLAEMARIGPETALGWFGERSPHNAPNPWAWCWRYTVRAAWEFAQAQLNEVVFTDVKEGGSAAGGGAREGDPIPPEPTAPPSRGFEDLKSAVEALRPADSDGAERILLDAARADLDSLRLDTLLQQIKLFTGIGITALRQRHAELAQTLREATADTGGPVEDTRYVYIRDQGRTLDRRSGQMLTTEALKTSMARHHRGDTNEAMDYWLTGTAATVPVVDTLTYDPRLPEGTATDERGVAVYNLYRPSPLQPVEGDVQPWLTLLNALQIEGDPAAVEALLDWFAFVVRHPGEKPGWGVLLGGMPGAGKDSLIAPVKACIGEANVCTVEGEEVANTSFTDYLGETKLLVVNEIKGLSASEVLKPALCAPPYTLRVNRKHQRPFEVPNRLAVLAMLNDRHGLNIDTGDRRWLCLWTRLRFHPNPRDPSRALWERFFTRYWHWLEHEQGANKVLAWLHQRDISRFNPHARPVPTPWKEELEEGSEDPLVTWLRSAWAEGVGALGMELTDAEAILWDAKQASFRIGVSAHITERRVVRALSVLGVPRRCRRGHDYYTPQNPSTEISQERCLKLERYKLESGLTGAHGRRSTAKTLS